ncbi:MAG: type II toxin-antitoxin system VapC family toxin [Deferrisomatales bacterium]|nr:type II toxin-antitoxin system VapC family toxin [Deferrisomatales bacterium]
MSFLVDTNVLSELSRAAPDAGVISWARGVTRIAVSVVTIDEVYFGLSWRPLPRVERWFESFLKSQCQVIPVTEEIARQSGLLRGRLKAGGSTRTQADMLLAATAQVHALTLVTRNERDFEGCGVAVLNPFSG